MTDVLSACARQNTCIWLFTTRRPGRGDEVSEAGASSSPPSMSQRDERIPRTVGQPLPGRESSVDAATDSCDRGRRQTPRGSRDDEERERVGGGCARSFRFRTRYRFGVCQHSELPACYSEISRVGRPCWLPGSRRICGFERLQVACCQPVTWRSCLASRKQVA